MTMTDLDYLTSQLDLLLAFQDVADEKIYNQIKEHDKYDLGLTIDQLYQGKYQNYSNHILTSTFILGFVHFEDFLTIRLTQFLKLHPEKNEYKIPIRVFNEKGNEIISYLAYEQARLLKFTEKINFIKKNVAEFNPELISDILYANDIRNCLMHNNGIADNRLNGKYNVGDKIIFNLGQVTSFCLAVRLFAIDLWKKTKSDIV